MRSTRPTPKHYRPYLLDRRFSARASQEAAVATAAYGVLYSIVSTVPNITVPARGRAVLATLLNQYNASVAAIPDSPFKRQGIEAGNAAAEAMIAARRTMDASGHPSGSRTLASGTGSLSRAQPTRHRGWVS